MKLINKKILFKPFPSKDKTEAGLFVPESAQEVNNKGTIVEIGNRVTKMKKGDVGFRVKGWGEEFIINGDKHYVMEEEAILAII